MYHIANDARARKSANLICSGVIALTTRKSFNEITIADVQRESTVSRSTFYRLFDNLTDPLIYECDQIIKEIATNMPTMTNLHDAQLYFISTWMTHADLLQSLVAANVTSILRAAHTELLPQMITYANHQITVDDDTIDYVSAILGDLLPTAMFVWLEHGRQEDAEKVYQQLKISIKLLGSFYQA